MKCPDKSHIDYLSDNGSIFYDFPEFYEKMMEKHLEASQWDKYHQLMRSHKRRAETLSSMMSRLVEHLEDWSSPTLAMSQREEERDFSEIGMLVFVPLLTDFCNELREKGGVFGQKVARCFERYLDVFMGIWEEAVEPLNECPYPEFLPTTASFEPFIEFFYDFVEEMKGAADEDFVTYVTSVYVHLYRMNAKVAECEKLSILERQYTECDFAKDLSKTSKEVKYIKDSLKESGFKNETLDELIEWLGDIEAKCRVCDEFLEEKSARIFGKKRERLAHS